MLVVAAAGKLSSRRVDLVVVWDLRTDGFHIPGAGPLTKESAAEVARQAFVTGLTHTGCEGERTHPEGVGGEDPPGRAGASAGGARARARSGG